MNSQSENPAPETLLTHQDFVRGLVRSLLRGADGEDDVVQSTWIRALTKPPRDSGRGRQWLATVARNMVRDHQRGQTRRTIHERRAPLVEESPSAAEVLHREDERKRVINAVLELSNPYRTAVLLRYWEDLPSRAIAARLGIPDATVRSHVRRGLEMLRQKLDEEYGSRDRWMIALIPCAAFPHTAKSTAGAILMSAKSKTVLTTCCLMIAGLALLGMFEFSGDTVPPATPSTLSKNVTTSASRQADQSTRNTTGDRQEPGQRSAIASSDAFTLLGSVTDDGLAVPDLVLSVQWFQGYGVEGDPVLEVSVRTNAAGNFVWRGPPPDVASTIQATTVDPLVKLICEPEFVSPDQTHARLTIRAIPLGCVLHGVISNDAGEGIAGARISVRILPGPRWPGTRADSQGQYSLRVARGEHSQSITIWAPDYTPQTIVTHIPESSDRYQLDFSLRAGGRIAGRVEDEDGAPVADVRIGTSAPKYHVLTDAAGRFELNSLSPATDHHIEARKVGYLNVGRTFAVGTKNATLVLRGGSVLFGRVLDSEGHAVAGAKITSSQTGYSGTDGSFRLKGIREGKGYALVTKSGFIRSWNDLVIPAEGLELIVRLEKGHSVCGRVTDTAGTPLADASVHVAIATSNGISMGEPSTRSDAEGYFEIRGLPSTKSIDVGAFKQGYQRSIVSNVIVGPTPITIRLERGASIAGRVIDSQTKNPIDRFGLRIAITDDQWSFRRAPTTIDGTDGYWESPGQRFEVGQQIFLLIEAEGYAPSRATAAAAIDPPRDQVVILMDRAATIVGTVRDESTGKPIVSATIKVVDADAEDLGQILISSTAVPSATSDASGRYEFTSLGPGSIKLIVTHPDYTEVIRGPFEIQTGLKPSTVDLQLGRGSRVRGQIEGFDGLNLRVAIMSREGHGNSQTLELGAKRSFVFEGVGDGRHVMAIYAEQSFVRLRTERLTVADADVEDIVFCELEGPCTVRVRVTGLDAGEGHCLPKEGTKGAIRGFEFQNGGFTLTGLSVGTHRILVEHGRRRVEREVTLESGKPKVLVIEIGN